MDVDVRNTGKKGNDNDMVGTLNLKSNIKRLMEKRCHVDLSHPGKTGSDSVTSACAKICGYDRPHVRPLSISFDILKFSLAARPRGHTQRKLNEHVYSFLSFESS